MGYILLGVIAFLLFLLYDVNSVIMKQRLFSLSFFSGFILLVISTGGIMVSSAQEIAVDHLSLGLFGFFALIFLFLLIYSLFFAIPFKNTYIEEAGPSRVCRTGMYALCRHPGVLWFVGFFLLLGFALPSRLMRLGGFSFSILNILYVIFQDRWTFVRTFADYEDYKISTPFLIPNKKSIKRCLDTLSGKKVTQ